jgi:uncharacterized damage-inducible protein DinB
MTRTPSDNFLEFSVTKLNQLAGRIRSCLDELSDDQIWTRGAEHENAVGNLCLHLSGNVRQWIIHGVGGAPDTRTRDAEFTARGGVPKAELLQRLTSTVQDACSVIASVPPERLTAVIRPQNYTVTILEAIYHVVEHFANHTGQIILLTKALTGKDLAFYRHLTGTSQPPPPPEHDAKP